jgi:hypothetical protein
LAHQHGLLLGKIEHGLADPLVALLRFDDVIGRLGLGRLQAPDLRDRAAPTSRRSASMRRLRAILNSQVASDDLAGSNRPALCHSTIMTSWVISSAWPGSMPSRCR